MLLLQDASPSPGPTTSTSPPSSSSPSVQASPSPANQPTHPVISSGSGWFLLLVALLILLAGLIVLWGRYALASQNPPGQPGAKKAEGQGSLVRSWVAVSLVSGLVIFCAAAFLIDDENLRSTLFGGLVTSVGAAVAFYFSSASADQARRDLLTAAGMTEVPDLVGTPPGTQTVSDAQAAIAQLSLKLDFADSKADSKDVVTRQTPEAGVVVQTGSTVIIWTEAPAAIAAADQPDPEGKA